MPDIPSFPKISAVLLAGGIGSRMQTNTPKQFLYLHGKPIVRFSFDLFLAMPEIEEIVVVCAPPYRHFFDHSSNKRIAFALPGERRQDSVYHGFMQTSPSSNFICIHDGARPCIDEALVKRVLETAMIHHAATVGMPVSFTVKQSDENNFVQSTPNRAHLWEIQTPQVVQRDLLLAGFQHVKKHNLTVTDDVSLVELLGEKVKLVAGSYTNLKITTPQDLVTAESLLSPLKHNAD